MGTQQRVLVTGGGTFLGNHIAAALLAESADVVLLVRPGAEEQLGLLAGDVEWHTADVWNPASLKGRARNATVVIHTVGSMKADPSQGFTHHYLNFQSARNVANMCVTDGAQRMLLISAARAPWVSRRYIRAKREAEFYMERVGLHGTVVRAPLLYQRGHPRPLVYRLMTLFSWLPPLRRRAPLSVDVLARGVARLSLNPDRAIYYAGDLLRLNTREERRGQPQPAPSILQEPPLHEEDTRPNPPVG